MKKIFLIDNYDSFTYNLSHYLEELGCKVVTKRNDMFDINEIKEYDGILISPGPGIPDEAGLLKSIISNYYKKLNIVYVAHVGDIVDDQDSTIQWKNASKSMMILENVVSNKFPDGIPYGVVPGNHDLLLKHKNISRRILNVLKLTNLRIKFYAFFIQTHDQ